MTPRNLKKTYEDLILKGINITRATQEGDAVYTADPDHLDNTFKRYQLWRWAIKDFLMKAGVEPALSGKFYESDSVPLFKGGFEYGDIQSEKSQTLLRKMRIETSKKLDLLRNLKQSLFAETTPKTGDGNTDVIIQGKTCKFRFDKKTGVTALKKTNVAFPVGQNKFKLLETLVSAKDNMAPYEDICKALNILNSKVSRRYISSLLKEVKEDLDILPKRNAMNAEIFFNIPGRGYRIVIS